MFQYNKNANGGVKSFTFYPNNKNNIQFVHCRLSSDDIICQPLHLSLSFISKIDYLKQDDHFFIISITDKNSDIYKFVFLKEMFCCDFTATDSQVETICKVDEEKLKIKNQVWEFVQSIHNNYALSLNIVKDKNLIQYFCHIENWANQNP